MKNCLQTNVIIRLAFFLFINIIFCSINLKSYKSKRHSLGVIFALIIFQNTFMSCNVTTTLKTTLHPFQVRNLTVLFVCSFFSFLLYFATTTISKCVYLRSTFSCDNYLYRASKIKKSYFKVMIIFKND